MEVNPIFPGGPYLVAALLCEKVLEEKDGVKTLVRIVDRLMHQVVQAQPPEVMPPVQERFALYLRFRCGQAVGTRELRLTIVKPSGESAWSSHLPIVFEEGDARFIDVVINLSLGLEMPGRWWFVMEMGSDGQAQRIAAIPLDVVYLPIRMPPAG